jgi:hypothetical protein
MYAIMGSQATGRFARNRASREFAGILFYVRVLALVFHKIARRDAGILAL